ERIKGEWWPRAVTEDYQLLVPLDDLDPGDAALCDVYGNDGDVLGGETPVTDGEDVLQLWGKNCTGAVIEAGMRCDKILRPWGRGAAPVGAGEDAMDLYELVPTACDPVFE